MITNVRPLALGFCALAVVALSACDRSTTRRSADAAEASVAVTPPAPRVMNVAIGNRSDSTLRVTVPTTDFQPRDTMYLAVEVKNPDMTSRLSARWTYQDGTVMDSSGQNIARDMAAESSVTQFKVWRDAGWKTGNYSVAIWLDGLLVDTKSFSVKR